MEEEEKSNLGEKRRTRRAAAKEKAKLAAEEEEKARRAVKEGKAKLAGEEEKKALVVSYAAVKQMLPKGARSVQVHTFSHRHEPMTRHVPLDGCALSDGQRQKTDNPLNGE